MNGGARPPVRITYLIGSLQVGGAEQQLVRLVNSLDRSRFQPAVLCLQAGGPLREELFDDVVVESVVAAGGDRPHRSRLLFGLRLLAGLRRSIRRQRPDVLHAYMPAAYVLGALVGRLAGARVIVAGRRGLVSYHVYPQRSWHFLARLANRVIDVHVCNSQAVRRYAIEREGLDPGRTRVVLNGVETRERDPAAALPSGWRRDASTVLVGCVANLIHYKNHDLLLRALPGALDECPQIVLVLLGDGPERPRLERLAEELGVGGSVIFAGRVARAAGLLPGFDLSVLTSDEEGLPNAVMESLAAGVPVVATAVGGTVELVEDGVHGLLVPPGDADALAAALVRLAADPGLRGRMGAAGRARTTAEFGVERMVAETEAIYEELLAGRVAAVAAA